MPDLPAWFSNYFSPSKITAVTVPGMILAYALILVLGPIPCSRNKDCPFCPTTLKPVTDKTPEKPGSGNAITYIHVRLDAPDLDA